MSICASTDLLSQPLAIPLLYAHERPRAIFGKIEPMLRKLTAIVLLFVFVPALLPAQERVDLAMIHRIKTEAFNNSRVMETMHQLTDRYGPRLTNSRQFRAAGEWAVKQLNEWGMSNAHLE